MGGSVLVTGAFGITVSGAGCLKETLAAGVAGKPDRFCAVDLLGGWALAALPKGAKRLLAVRTGGTAGGIEAAAFPDEDGRGAKRPSVFWAGDTPKSPKRLREVLLLASPNLWPDDTGEPPNALSVCKPESFGEPDVNVWLLEPVVGLSIADLANTIGWSSESDAVEAASVPRVDERNLATCSESANMLAGGSGGVNGRVETGIGL